MSTHRTKFAFHVKSVHGASRHVIWQWLPIILAFWHRVGHFALFWLYIVASIDIWDYKNGDAMYWRSPLLRFPPKVSSELCSWLNQVRVTVVPRLSKASMCLSLSPSTGITSTSPALTPQLRDSTICNYLVSFDTLFLIIKGNSGWLCKEWSLR